MINLPNPFYSGVDHPPAPDEAAASPFAFRVDAAAEIAESFMTDGGPEKAPLAGPPNTRPVSGLLDDLLHGPFEPDMDALYDAIVPPEPPVFLRSPSQSFIRALVEWGR